MNATQSTFSLKSVYIDFREITKARLAISVVFSSIAGFMLGIYDLQSLDWLILLKLAIGGYCMVGASNAFNQVIEKDLDALMDRTKNRPVPAGRMTQITALIIASLLTIIGIALLYTINPKTAMFGAVSIFWQFPHFWAIGWFLYEDYEKAGFFMLPTGKKDKGTALQIILYTVWLILASLLPVLGYTGRFYMTPIAAVLVFLFGLWMLFYAVRLYKLRTAKAARTLMLVSVSYITLLQLVYIFDKFLR